MQIDKMIKKELISLLTSVIILALLFIGVSFAAFLSIKEGNAQTINVGDLAITFCDDSSCESGYENIGQVIGTSNEGTLVSMFPYSTDDEALLSSPYIFKIENSGTIVNYLTIKLLEDTSFVPSGDYEGYESITKNYMKYLKVGINECSDGIIKTAGTIIYKYSEISNGVIKSDDKFEPNEEKTYCLWTWLDSTTPNEVQNTYFVANLEFEAEYRPINCDLSKYEANTLLYYIMKDNGCGYPDNINSKYVNNTVTGIDFSKISSNTNGKGFYYTSDLTKNEDYDKDGQGETVYYYRGDIENNNIVFAGYCWMIVRTTEDGGVKLFYNGEYDPVNKCAHSSNSNITIGSSRFNSTYGDTAYSGYMMGMDNVCNNVRCQATTNTTSYEEAHANMYDSQIKKQLDNWYETNILIQGTDITSKIVNTKYCNDRKIAGAEENYSQTYTQLGYGNNTTHYAGYSRLWKNYTPQFKCEQQNDEFTLRSDIGGIEGYGNNALQYPVALLTADELSYAGTTSPTKNTSYFLYKNDFIWTMTPSYYDERDNIVNGVIDGRLTNSFGIDGIGNTYPVITIKDDVIISQGSGTPHNPYIVEEAQGGLIIHVVLDNKNYIMYAGTKESCDISVTLYDKNGLMLLIEPITVTEDTKYQKIVMTNPEDNELGTLTAIFTAPDLTPLRPAISIELN